MTRMPKSANPWWTLCAKVAGALAVGALLVSPAFAEGEGANPAGANPAGANPAVPGAPPASEVDRLLAQLGDDDWRTRESASDALKAAGEGVLPRLITEYRRTRDAEVRARVPEIARDLFWRHRAGFLGIRMSEERFGEQLQSVLITDVVAGCAAEKAGLRGGDRIVRFNGVAVSTLTDINDFSRLVLGRGPGRATTVVVDRDGERVTVEVVLGRLTPDQLSLRLDSLEPAHLTQFEDWWNAELKAAAAASAGAKPAAAR
jgi:C-terminal processing protease CtpA/Prc